MQHRSVHQSITDDVRYSEYTTSPSPSRLTTLLPAGWALSDGFSKGRCGIVTQWHRKETVGPCAHKFYIPGFKSICNIVLLKREVAAG